MTDISNRKTRQVAPDVLSQVRDELRAHQEEADEQTETRRIPDQLLEQIRADAESAPSPPSASIHEGGDVFVDEDELLRLSGAHRQVRRPHFPSSEEEERELEPLELHARLNEELEALLFTSMFPSDESNSSSGGYEDVESEEEGVWIFRSKTSRKATTERPDPLSMDVQKAITVDGVAPPMPMGNEDLGALLTGAMSQEIAFGRETGDIVLPPKPRTAPEPAPPTHHTPPSIPFRAPVPPPAPPLPVPPPAPISQDEILSLHSADGISASSADQATPAPPLLAAPSGRLSTWENMQSLPPEVQQNIQRARERRAALKGAQHPNLKRPAPPPRGNLARQPQHARTAAQNAEPTTHVSTSEAPHTTSWLGVASGVVMMSLAALPLAQIPGSWPTQPNLFPIPLVCGLFFVVAHLARLPQNIQRAGFVGIGGLFFAFSAAPLLFGIMGTFTPFAMGLPHFAAILLLFAAVPRKPALKL